MLEYFVQQLINGLTLGSIYGLIAIGYTMVYGIIGMINFAHGDVFMIGAFVSLIAFLVLGMIGITWLPFAIASQSSEVGAAPLWSWPVRKVTAWFTSRCVTGTPA